MYMKRKGQVLLFFLIGLIVSSCCIGAKMDGAQPLVSLFRFSPGKDYSNHIWVNWRGYIIGGEHRPIALDSGYYVVDYVSYPREDSYFLTFTFDDLENNRIPEDWHSHWRDYVLDQNPFAQFFTVWAGDCHGNLNRFPAYCCTCESTLFVDTTILNRMIANQEFINVTDYIGY